MRINWYEPRFGEEELEGVTKVIKDAYVNEGPKTKEFEKELRDYLGVKYVLLIANATAGLFLAVKADSIIKGKKDFEVIVPDMTMIATANSVEWAGGKPILVDIEKERTTISVSEIEKKITNKTTAIIPVHVLGRAADMEEIEEIAKKHGLSIIEDSAGALGSRLNGKLLGTFGKVGCFSLQANKIITSGQGGIVVTNDERYYEVMKRLSDFGRMSNKEFIHQKIGYNLKFNDLSSALGMGQFHKIDKRIEMLKSQRKMYEKELIDLDKVRFFPLRKEEVPLWIDVLVENREELVKYLNKNEIYPRKCWPSIHKNPPYEDQGNDQDFPNSTYLSDNCLWLPNGPAISNEQIVFISKKIKEFYNGIKKDT